MEAQNFIVIGASLGFTVALFMGLWALGLRFRKPFLKRLAVQASLVCLLVIAAYALQAFLNNAPPPDFVTEVPGPPTGQGSTSRQVTFPVTDAYARQVVELTMKAYEAAEGTLPLLARVMSPQGKVLTMSEQTVTADQGRMWHTMRFEFEAEQAGDHTLFVEIPQRVDMMRVVVKEVVK